MQPSLGSLSKSPPTRQDLDQLAQQALLEWGNPHVIRRQLNLLPPGTWVRRGGTEKVAEAIAAIPIEEAVSLLPTVDKISVLNASVGVFKTCQLLPLRKSDLPIADPEPDPEVQFQDLIAFAVQLSALTDGVVDCPQLSPLRVLRMQCFALVDKWFKEMEAEKKYKFDCYNLDEAKPADPIDVVKKLQQHLERIFHLIDLDLLLSDSPTEFLSDIKAAEVCCDNYRLFWASKPDRQQQVEEARQMALRLDFLKKASVQYWLLMPLLQRPIKKIPYDDGQNTGVRPEPTVDKSLHDFLSAFHRLSASGLDFLEGALKEQKDFKSNKAAFQDAKKTLTQFVQDTTNVIGAVAETVRQLRAFETLPPVQQHLHVSQLDDIFTLRNQAMDDFNALGETYKTYIQKLNVFVPFFRGKSKKGTDLDKLEWIKSNLNEYTQHPWHTLKVFVAALLNESLDGIQNLQKLHQGFNTLLAPPIAP